MKRKKLLTKVLASLLVLIIGLVPTITSFASLTVGDKYSYTVTYLDAYYDTGTWHTANGHTHNNYGQVGLRNLKSTGEPLYCMQVYEECDNTSVTANNIESSKVWQNELTDTAKKGIRLVSIYGYDNYNYGYSQTDAQLATQILIWEFETGIRTNFTTSILKIGQKAFTNYPNAAKCYQAIMEACDKHYNLPTFSPNKVELKGIGSGNAVTLTDTSGTLGSNDWDIVVNDSKVNATIQGNKLVVYATSTGKIDTQIILTKKHTRTSTALAMLGANQELFYGTLSDPASLPVTVELLYGNIEITKMDNYGAGVDGAKFGLYTDNSCTNRISTVTSTNGKVAFNNLLPNTYYVKEVSAPTGYLLSDKVTTCVVESGTTKKYDCVNSEPTGKITVTKELDVTKTNGLYGDVNISQAQYQLVAKTDIKSANGSKKFYSKGDVVGTKNITPNSDNVSGTITWNNIPLGEYYVKEVTAPNGAFIDTTEYTVSLKYKNQTTNLIVDSSTTSTDVVKSMTANIFKEGVKGQSGLVQGLAGAEFTIKLYSDYQTALQQGYKIEEIWATKNSNNEWYGIDINGRKVKVDATRAANANNIAPTYDTVTTDSEGNAVTTYLPYGRYITKETVTPVNFQSGNDFIFSVTKDESEVDSAYQKVIRLVVNNAPFEAPVKIIKKDIDSDKPVTLSSASYKIRATQDIIDTATGNVIYKQGDFVEVKIGNNKYNEFMTNSDELVAIQDANIYASKGDEKGSVTTPFSLPSGYYELVEVKAPNGFLIDDTPIPFVVTNTIDLDQDADGEPVCVVSQSNQQPKGELVINKTFFERADVDKTLIDNIDYTAIKFNVFAKDNIVDMTDGSVVYEEGTLIDTYSLNSDATLNIDNMWVGNYIVKEAETIEGAVLDETEYEVGFSVKDNTTPVYTETLNVVNFTTLVQISKNTITGENELEGATLTVKDSEGNIIDTWVSTDTAHTIEGLIVGKTYTLTEEIAPNGFVKATTIEFTIDNNNNVQKVAMVDKQLLISKVNATTGEELEGAELTITDSEGNVVDSWISTTTPHYASGLIEGETYTLTEITAPYGFKVAESVTFTVSADKETQKVVMKDDYIYSSVRVLKCDIQTKKPIISNAFEFSIYADKECTQLIETSGANKSEGTALFENLIYGTYYIKETKAPLGYSLSDQVVEIVINEGGVFADGVNLAEENGIYSFEYYDELLPVLNTGDTTDISKAITLIVLIAALAGWLVIVKNLFKMKNKEAQEPEQKDGKDE